MSANQRETFGAYLKKLRLNETIGLREFPSLINMRLSLYSEIERSIVLPPQDEKILEEMIRTLGYGPNSPEEVKFYRLAKQDNDNPPELSKARGIPVLPRYIDRRVPNENDIRELTTYIQGRVDSEEQVTYAEAILA